MRTITIHDGMPDTLSLAMPRFSTWGMPDYTTVDIFVDRSVGENGLVAIFKTENGHRFEMGAVWNKDKQEYSYHS